MSARTRLIGGAACAATATAVVAVLAAVAVSVAAAGAAPAPAAAAGASPPLVETMVVGRAGELVSAPRARSARAIGRRVNGRRCAVGAATPLAVLLSTPASVRLKDFGSCSGRARDAGGLFVTSVAGQRNRGVDGWVYKVGARAGTTGAADLSGSFGNGRRLRAGDRVLWFWCRMRATGCQRTLEVKPATRSVRAGEPLTVTVSGNDDRGRGVAVAGAGVTFAGQRATTDSAGRATLTAPASPSASTATAEVQAVKPGLVRAFPVDVKVTG